MFKKLLSHTSNGWRALGNVTASPHHLDVLLSIGYRARLSLGRHGSLAALGSPGGVSDQLQNSVSWTKLDQTLIVSSAEGGELWRVGADTNQILMSTDVMHKYSELVALIKQLVSIQVRPVDHSYSLLLIVSNK